MLPRNALNVSLSLTPHVFVFSLLARPAIVADFFPSPSVGSRRIGRSDNGGISFLESATTPPPRSFERGSFSSIGQSRVSRARSLLSQQGEKLLTYLPDNSNSLPLPFFRTFRHFETGPLCLRRGKRGIYPLPCSHDEHASRAINLTDVRISF